MEAAKIIRKAVAGVSLLREERAGDASLYDAVLSVKRFQARRFAGTYWDLLADPRYQAAARFFLVELYSDKDFSERDMQFSRIAGAMERFFPAQVVAIAVALAELHALTEELDHLMGRAWLESDERQGDARRYIGAWRRVGRREDRDSQLRVVLLIGDELGRMTRTRGLHVMLRMMRGPASAAGLHSLQSFLESGFETFAAISRRGDVVARFLSIIRTRESQLISALYDADAVTFGTELEQALGQAR